MLGHKTRLDNVIPYQKNNLNKIHRQQIIREPKEFTNVHI